MTTALKSPAKTGNSSQAAPPPNPYPFPVGVYESVVQDYDNTVALGLTIAAWTTPIQLPVWNVSPTGWLRGLWFDFAVTVAGNAATPALKEDGPWSFIQNINLFDLGGVAVMTLSGYEWMVINKFGGYFEVGDPRADLTYSLTAGSGASAGSFHFILYLPFEVVARDALGTVQNESKPGWKIQINADSAANVYATTPTGTGTAALRLRAYPNSYTEPSTAAPSGRQFSQSPPLPGTLQYWKSENLGLPSGSAKYDVSNGMGYPVRNAIFYVKDAGTGSRATADANWPDPATLLLGNVNIFTRSKNLWISLMSKAYGYANVGGTSPAADSACGRENGVFPYWLTSDMQSHPGDELRFKYLDTQVNTLMRFSGSFGGTVTFYVLMNWLATPSKNRYALIAGSGQ